MKVTRFIVATLTVTCLASPAAFAASFSELQNEANRAQREYNLEGAEDVFVKLQAYVLEQPSDETNLLLAEAALLVTELRRMDYETADDMDAREKRLLGRTIDDVAKIGLDTAKLLPESSEKWRIISDLYGPMIRSKYKGQKYHSEMENATERALELNPNNPKAIVSGCKRKLFASPNQGGDVPVALEMLNRALELDPSLEIALIFRGIAYDKLDQRDKAETDWKQVLDTNPSSRLARNSLKGLTQDIEF